ncbi:hypothetical protein [Amycolatopsis sp. lyj-23]|uniref:hypothetical protein n=1 Tax=Amycolatopsis sp. lyj-23 TaxID=2789283 RepID=UPI003978FD30
MTEEELNRTAVSVLSHYLQRRSSAGPAAYDGPLENLLGRVQARFADPFLAEVFARFAERPSGMVEAETMRLYLGQETARDEAFARELTSALAGRKVRKAMNPGRRARVALLALGGLVLLASSFVVGRVSAPRPTPPAAAPAATVTVSPAASSAPATEATESSASATTSTTTSATGSAGQAVSGDGGSVPKDSPVLLVDLPRPSDDWHFEHGDHDVQLTQYQNSMWNMLATCNSSAYRGEQQFRLKNFTRLEAKAVGTDSTASPDLAVKFEVFVNDDAVNAKQTVVVNPGESKPLSVELPRDVYAVTLRTSFTSPSGKPCRSGNAVWGSPFVVAAGR